MSADRDDRAEKTRAMKALPDDARRDAIDAAPNVLGFDRFQQRAKQVDLRDAYRKPPSNGGKA